MKTPHVKVVAARAGAAVLLSFGLIAGLAGVPADAQTPIKPQTPAATLSYTVLGDSYSAGSGGGGESGACLQSPNGYGNDFAAATGSTLTNLACYGATTTQVRTEQVPAIPRSTRLITLTVGANDVGTGTVSTACLTAPTSSTCTEALANAFYQMTILPRNISALVKAIKVKAPAATVVFLGYPHLFEPANMALAGYSPAQVNTAKTINSATDLLDGVIAASAITNGAKYVSVTGRFAGHGIPSPAQWLISPIPPSLFAFHPNATGYKSGYAAALEAAL